MSEKGPTREGIDRSAKMWRDAVRQSGNTNYSQQEARDRVEKAVQVADQKRANGNR